MERRDFDAPRRAEGGAARRATSSRPRSAMARLARLVRRGRFDLVYCNGTNADFAGGALARLTGVPGSLARALHVAAAARWRRSTGA